MDELFHIEILEYDEDTNRYEWFNETQTPIFEQACAIMKHMAEINQKARMFFYGEDEDDKIYFFNYDL